MIAEVFFFLCTALPTYPSTIIDHRALAQRPEALALALVQLILQIHDAGDRHHERATSYNNRYDEDDEALPPVLSYRRADEYLAAGCAA